MITKHVSRVVRGFWLLGLVLALFVSGPLEAKTYLITCATSDLGEAMAVALAEEGHELVLTGRDLKKLEDFAKSLPRQGDGRKPTMVLPLDMEDQAGVGTFGLRLANALGSRPLDGIVLVGPRPSFSSSGIPGAHEWQRNLQLAFIGPLEALRQAATYLAPHAAVVVVSGLSSKYFMSSYPNSNVLRVMWTAEVKNLMTQLAVHKTRVNAISPGVLLTSANIQKVKQRAEAAQISSAEQLRRETTTIPAGRHGQPEDFVGLAKFLLSDAASFVNGENIALDGGLSPAY